MLLDEVVFQQKSVQLRVYHNELDVTNLPNKNCRFPTIVLVFGEIRRHTLLQVLGLPNVDYGSVLIEILVYTRRIRNGLKKGADMFWCLTDAHCTNITSCNPYL